MEEVYAAADAAQIRAFIESLPEKVYNFMRRKIFVPSLLKTSSHFVSIYLNFFYTINIIMINIIVIIIIIGMIIVGNESG